MSSRLAESPSVHAPARLVMRSLNTDGSDSLGWRADVSGNTRVAWKRPTPRKKGQHSPSASVTSGVRWFASRSSGLRRNVHRIRAAFICATRQQPDHGRLPDELRDAVHEAVHHPLVRLPEGLLRVPDQLHARLHDGDALLRRPPKQHLCSRRIYLAGQSTLG